jgi:hypothetical protein
MYDKVASFGVYIYKTNKNCRSAQMGALAGSFLVAPYYYFTGKKLPFFRTLMPKVAGTWMLGGGLLGGAMVAAMAVSPPPKDKAPFTNVSNLLHVLVGTQQIVCNTCEQVHFDTKPGFYFLFCFVYRDGVIKTCITKHGNYCCKTRYL